MMEKTMGRKTQLTVKYNQIGAPIGPKDVSTELRSFIGVLARTKTYCPIDKKDWDAVEQEGKDLAWDEIKSMATGKFFRQVELPEQKTQDDGVPFPVVLSPYHPIDLDLGLFEEAIRAHKPWLQSLFQKCGAILFRGFPVTSPSDFNDVVEAFGFPEMLYLGGAPRIKVGGRVYTSNESPPEIGIPFHHEMATLRDYPSKLFFFCEEEPGSGGETPIALSHIIYDRMKQKHPEFVAKLEEYGMVYLKLMCDNDDSSNYNGCSWKSVYMTDDKSVAEERAAKQGAKLEWIGNVAKTTTRPVPAVRFDMESQRKTWFNYLQAVTYTGPVGGKDDDDDDLNKSAMLGNGEYLPDHVIEDCRKILEEECAAIPWKKGDVLLVNNLMVLHGRRPLVKPPRRILASLCK